jgi:hypothetical protein
MKRLASAGFFVTGLCDIWSGSWVLCEAFRNNSHFLMNCVET